MKIVYQGTFLKSGLRALGHDVFDIRLREDAGINEQVMAVCPEPDLVLLELWGDFKLPFDLHRCAWRLAAWCIDSTLNEFWLEGLLDIFDDVFVDQKPSAVSLASKQTTPLWLPLCADEADFREPGRAKEHDISFVGRITEHRKKRANLLGVLGQRFKINLVQDVSVARMQDVFARSKIVLNENFFPGLTLRIFQGLASGGLVFTEAGLPGVDDFFIDGRHLVCYNPHSVFSRLDSILENYDLNREIAFEGQRECRLFHTSRHRAEWLIEHVGSIPAKGKRSSAEQTDFFAFLAARSLYLLSCRYGGSYARSVGMLVELARGNGEAAIMAAGLLGVIFARTGRLKSGLDNLERHAKHGLNISPFLNIALIHLRQEKADDARQTLERGLAAHPETARLFAETFQARSAPPGDRPGMLFFMAGIYFVLGRLFCPGFLRQGPDPMPDTAFDLACLAWRECRDPAILDFMLNCLKPFRLEPELLPELVAAIREGAATDAQILRTAELAAAYYDRELAHTISSALAVGKR